MYKNLLILTLIILLIILIILLIKFQNKELDFNDNEIIKYKITNKKEMDDLSDKFNIKEYDIINENIIIHNKFKNELLE